jgi:hypothetical protein
MWVVTTDAPHSVARFFLAAALRQSLHLTDCAQSCTLPRTLPTNQHKIADVVRERRSRTKLVNVSPRALNGIACTPRRAAPRSTSPDSQSRHRFRAPLRSHVPHPARDSVRMTLRCA